MRLTDIDVIATSRELSAGGAAGEPNPTCVQAAQVLALLPTPLLVWVLAHLLW